MIKVNVLAPDWVDRALLQIYVEPRKGTERFEDRFDSFYVLFDRVNEYGRIRVNGSSPFCCCEG